jgi:hypothetical protein
MRNDQVVPDLISVGLQALKERAKDLGITWGLRPATVVSVHSYGLNATYDGDTKPINMTSMIGTLGPGERVYVLSIPPSGNFVVGRISNCESGDELVSFTTQTGFTRTINFINPFVNNPRVFCNINTGSGVANGWNVRAFNVSPSGFTMFGFGASTTWTNVNVYWMAFAR